MTAIAVSFDPLENRFEIAADGRCATSIQPIQVKTDTEQKIFNTQNLSRSVNVAYAMTGFARIGSFEMIAEVQKQIETLSKRQFSDGYEFCEKACFNMTKVLEKALRDGNIPAIPVSTELPPEEAGRICRIFLLGFFQDNPFFRIASFHYDDGTHCFRVGWRDLKLLQHCIFPFGSDRIEGMLFGTVTIDPRLAHYAQSKAPDTLTAITNYIRACSHPAAVELDPWCRMIGGHIHAAELSKNAFRWLIPPAAL
jgi:hypothetical protein